MSVRVEVERSGRFAGAILRSAVDTAQLPADRAAELESLVEAADLPALAGRSGPSPGAPDRFQYAITVTRDGSTQRVDVDETDLTPDLRALVDRTATLGRA